jgi:F-type H+-transporting ATPase subunit gamma
VTLRDIRRRIRSVKNTEQITRAMEMVAAAKLRRAQARVVAGRPYAARIAEMLHELGSGGAGGGDDVHPYMVARPVKKRAMVLVTADRGLCGAFNSGLVRYAIHAYRVGTPGSLAFVLVGKKGTDALRRTPIEVLARFPDLGRELTPAFVGEVADTVSRLFTEGTVDAVDIVYMRFISALNRKLTEDRLLPVSAGEMAAVTVAGPGGAAAAGTGHTAPGGAHGDFILEPSPEAIYRVLMPRYLRTRIFSALRESSASEQGARMIAMGSATRNAEDLTNVLTLEMNRARQAAITKELAEIVGSAEAMK